MKNRITSLILIILFASCKSNTIYDEPKDLIPKDSMVLLLKDLYLATSAKSIKNKKRHSKGYGSGCLNCFFRMNCLTFSGAFFLRKS